MDREQTDKLIREGAAAGKRFFVGFRIAAALYDRGLTDLEVTDAVTAFGHQCQPPLDAKGVRDIMDAAKVSACPSP